MWIEPIALKNNISFELLKFIKFQKPTSTLESKWQPIKVNIITCSKSSSLVSELTKSGNSCVGKSSIVVRYADD